MSGKSRRQAIPQNDPVSARMSHGVQVRNHSADFHTLLSCLSEGCDGYAMAENLLQHQVQNARVSSADAGWARLDSTGGDADAGRVVGSAAREAADEALG